MENLSQQEIKDKINSLEKSIRLATIRNGTEHFCKNRIERVKKLKTYLKTNG